ncbi:glycoprotein endo-alpha-1,2-mannosidase-like [Saccoglossus kowalevskii]|uniref:Glycoprotein endo-alpha-1,2-mannosidase-like n=1 Tax=Saccoglossus kowalevskii TaxID=10224 RepID=A0ABM0GTH3_SACKO|nr:PREDICTED: glycoprotein endo-alpha-1,2-mannosidase-like [Saccoglossus kowalevskii]
MARLCRKQNLFFYLVFVCFAFGCLYMMISITQIEFDQGSIKNPENSEELDSKVGQQKFLPGDNGGPADILDKSVELFAGLNPKVAAGLKLGSAEKLADDNNNKPKVVTVESLVKDADHFVNNFPPPNYNIHVFYYPWYGNPEYNRKYVHWNHGYIEHWDKKIATKWPTGRHQPPDDIGSNFYPELGCYSSSDVDVMDNHMQQIRSAGIGVVVVSWYPPEQSDPEGIPSDSLIIPLLDAAYKYQLKIAIHSEPYKDRDDHTLKEDVKYIIDSYAAHPAFYTYETQGRMVPLIYVYDSYLTKPQQWKRLLKPDGKHSIRGTRYDAIFIALLVDLKHKNEIISSGFDGFYTYFATNGFTYGSAHKNWKELSRFAGNAGLMFIPSVGPGYVDTRIRPWNAQNTRQRMGGKYYNDGFQQAFEADTEIISITSFNEWHEGSQIEKAVPKKTPQYTYMDYAPQKSDYYLQTTRDWVDKFAKKQENNKLKL